MAISVVRRPPAGVLMAVIVLAGFPLMSLSGGSRASAHQSTDRAGAVLRVSDEGVQDVSDGALDPPGNTLGANANLISSLVFGGLVRLDYLSRVQPDGANSWTVSRDKLTYTFHIRNGLRFANGHPVTAYDFAYSIDRAFSPQFASAGNTEYYLNNILGGPYRSKGKIKHVTGVQALNRSLLQIRLKTPTAVFLDQLAATSSGSQVVPRDLIQRYGTHWTEHAVGTGPFYIQRLQHSSEVDLAPNPYYWRGKPRLAQMRILFIQNADTAYNLYRTGGLDVLGSINFPSDRYSEARSRSDFHHAANLGTTYIPPNEKKPPFNNIHVRRAFSFAIDRNLLVNKFLAGQYVAAHSILPPGMPGYNPATKGQVFDPNAAKSELAKAGYPNGKGFPKVSLSFSGGDSGQTDSSQVLQRMWAKYLNVNVTLNKMEQNAYNDLLNARNYQLAYISWGEDYPDPQNFLSLQLQTGVGNNNGGFSDRTFDRLTAQADTIIGNNQQRYALYDRAERIALDKAAWIVLYHPKWAMLINPHVHGLLINGGGLTAYNWATVTVQ